MSNAQDLKSIIHSMDEPRAKPLCKMFWGIDGIWDRFCTSPASSKYHNSYAGGLLDHSIAVTKLMLQVSKSLNMDISIYSIYLVGLLHDLGKIGSQDEHAYLPATEDWQKKKGIKFTSNPKVYLLPHCAWTIFWLMKYNVPINQNEFQAILFHDGLYTPMGKAIKNNETELQWLLHTCDVRSAFHMEE